MARALQDILTELNSTYQPQKDLYNKQLGSLDPQMIAEEKGLQATKEDSFNQITQGANRRGLLFSGIPLAEQASYTGQQFLPAVANLKAKYAQQRFNLQDALAKINQDQYKTAYDIYGNELAQDEAARARAAAGSGGFSPSMFGAGGGGSRAAGSQGGGVNIPAGLQALYNQVFLKSNGSEWDDASLVNDYNATYKSAGYGNQRDKQKLELYHMARPDLFGPSIPLRVVDNGQNIGF